MVGVYVTYIDGELAWGAADDAGRGQGFRDVFERKGCGADLHGEADHQVTIGTLERPAVPWLDIRLERERERGIR